MELTDHSRVGIVGGGPAGSMTAYFLLDLAHRVGLNLKVDVFEPRDFHATGPAGCNMCGGVVSESLVQKLAVEGINLPVEVLMDTIDAYTLHTDSSSVCIQAASQEMRIACIFRGGGPLGAEQQKPLPWQSFDQYLLDLAITKGAEHLPERVTKLDWHEGKPVIHWGKDLRRRYDLLVGAVGLNGNSYELFQNMGFGYRAPKMAKTYIAELYLGLDQVKKRLGHAMHIFLLDIPGLKFLAITPKGPYATLVILGEDISKELIKKVFQSPEVKKCLPEAWDIPVRPCQCQPRINLGAPKNPYTDRVVMVGDCSSSRLFKDGIGAAYRLAKACAYTAVSHGVAASDFRKSFAPACAALERDNQLGRLLFAIDGYMRPFTFIQEGLLEAVRWEQQQSQYSKRLSMALWDTFTGSATYRNIFLSAVHPMVVGQLLWRCIRQLVRLGSAK